MNSRIIEISVSYLFIRLLVQVCVCTFGLNGARGGMT